MKFFIADAFTDTLFGGNPAGVVLIPDGEDFPNDEIMRKTAAELRYSETAFIKRITHDAENNDNKETLKPAFHARYFTPTGEVDLCGHATIASFYSLAKAGLLSDESVESISVHTLAGDIEIQIEYEKNSASESSQPSFLLMDMADPKHISTINDAIEIDRLYEIMGTEFDQSINLLPMIMSTGLPDIMMPMANQRELDSLNPDFDALSKLSEKYNVTGVHAFCIEPNQPKQGEDPSNADIICHTRNFAPLYGIDEEAATGTSSGALTYYLCLNQKIGTHAKCQFIQGEAMDRPSIILTTIDAHETCRIRVGGRAAILAEGEIDL